MIKLVVTTRVWGFRSDFVAVQPHCVRQTKIEEDNVAQTWHCAASFLFPFVHLGPKEARVG